MDYVSIIIWTYIVISILIAIVILVRYFNRDGGNNE